MEKIKVVIVGGGFGGIEAVKVLCHENTEITIINKTNHHLFQPLLYQVATGGLAAPSIGAPLRTLMQGYKNVTTILGEVIDVNAQTREVVLRTGQRFEYDYLIAAAGATHSYFGNDQWEEHAPGMKTLRDAFNIRGKVTRAFEAAEIESDPEKRAALLTFAVIGAGPTGVEMAGTLAEISRQTLRGEFRNIDPTKARILLIEGGARVLQTMPEKLSQRAKEQLNKLGVEVQLNARVVNIDAEGLDLLNPPAEGETEPVAERINSRCIIWAAGVAASPFGKTLAQAVGAQTDRAGRVVVDRDLSIDSDKRIYVIGDLAAAKSYVEGAEPKAVPGVSPAAKQMGKLAAANILAREQGKQLRAFKYSDYGNLATIGRMAAVVDLETPFKKNLQFSGMLAWQFWLFAHIYFLIGFRNRFVVLLDWASAYWTFNRYARVVADITDESVREDAAPESEARS